LETRAAAIVRPPLALRQSLPRRLRPRHVTYFKVENQIRRNNLPQRIAPSKQERWKLVWRIIKLGSEGHATDLDSTVVGLKKQ
jgi:hypothetical protein